MAGGNPRITALVCTAERAQGVVRTVASILANTHPDFEVVVVDQSSADETIRALEPLMADRRVVCIRTPVKGKGRALNLGLARARSDVVACTDDDCEVPPDWLERMESVFAADAATAIVFGTVEAAAHDASLGFVPTHVPLREELVRSIFRSSRARGIGACMGVRRSVIASLGGFDPAFGPGGKFHSGDDSDIATRALLRGYGVRETPSVSVLHYGFRSWREGRKLAYRDWYAAGALYAKPMRAGDWRIVYAAVELFLQRALWPPVCDLIHFRRPVGLTAIVAFVRGFARGLATPVRNDTLVFDVGGVDAPPAG